MRGALGAALVPVILAPSLARAEAHDRATVDKCVDANEGAQDLAMSGALVEARARLATCAVPKCPGPVRDDCATRLAALDERTPTLILTATGGSPRKATALDGKPLPPHDPAEALRVDPGTHTVTFEGGSEPAVAVTFAVREGEKGVRVRPPEDSPAANVQRPMGLVLGGVGLAGLALGGVLAIVAKSTDSDALRDACGGNADACTADGVRAGQSAHAEASWATFSLVGGGLLLGTGIALYLTAPGGQKVSVGTSGGNGRVGLSISGSFL